MVDIGTASDTKKHLIEWIEHVLEGIHKNYITSESDLESKVRVLSDGNRAIARFNNSGVDPPPTLLELLGYNDVTCDDHPTITTSIKGHKAVKIIPDYIVKSIEQKDLATWELKAPAEDVDSRESVEQLMSYCLEAKRQTPIGVLFNGRKLRVYINPDYQGLGKYKKISEAEVPLIDFRHSPVLSLDLALPELDDKKPYKQVGDTLISLSCAILSAGSVNLAKKIADKRLGEIKDEKRNAQIVLCLQEAFASPTDEILKAVTAAIHQWDGVEAPPGPDDAVRAWHNRKDKPKQSQTIKTVETQAKQSINGIVRQKVVQLCTSKGYAFLNNANVKGLRFRNEGGNGYHPVPQAEGVPSNLFVGGLSSEDAKKVIYQLDALLSQ